MVKKERVRKLNSKPEVAGPVVYWMNRDQRVQDNWALLYAQELAIKHKKELKVIFYLSNEFLGATLRQYQFMIDGLTELEKELKKLNIPFSVVSNFMDIKAGILVTDFSPLKLVREWKNKLAKKIDCAFYEVDAHNIVPVWVASNKQEFGAYTIRPKIKRLLPTFLEEFPRLKTHNYNKEVSTKYIDWSDKIKKLNCDRNIKLVTWLKSGSKIAKKTLKSFIDNKLIKYDSLRNDPSIDFTSNLSPYLHFGQISAQRVALEVLNAKVERTAKDVFLEELIIRRELSDNFCFYNPNYDSINSAPNWALKTIKEHSKDKRSYIYTASEFEKAETHDELWNAAQLQMLRTGKMHGYIRMYWCKKILEWTKNHKTALEIAIYLNDKYELDGRDPNGYTGIAWSIFGLHDRAWGSRPIFGKIRYMSYNGVKSKFDIKSYIKNYSDLK